MIAGHFCDGGDSFHGSGVRELRHSGDDISDGVKSGLVRFHVRAGVNEAALDFGFRFFEAEIFRFRQAADRRSELFRRRSSAFCRPRRCNETVAPFASVSDALHFRAGLNLDALFRERFLERGEISSSSKGTTRGNISRIVTSVPNELKIEANSTPTAPAPIDDQRFRNCGQLQNFAIAQNYFAVDGHARQRAGFGAGGEHHVFRFDLGGLAVFFYGHASRAGAASPAGDGLTLFLRNKKFDALGVLVDDFVLAREHGFPSRV